MADHNKVRIDTLSEDANFMYGIAANELALHLQAKISGLLQPVFENGDGL